MMETRGSILRWLLPLACGNCPSVVMTIISGDWYARDDAMMVVDWLSGSFTSGSSLQSRYVRHGDHPAIERAVYRHPTEDFSIFAHRGRIPKNAEHFPKTRFARVRGQGLRNGYRIR